MIPTFAAPDFDWAVLKPFVIMALTGVVALLALLFQTKTNTRFMARCTLIGIFCAFVSAAGLFGNSYLVMNDMITKMNPGMIGEILILISTFVTVLISRPFLEKEGINCPEFYPLITWSALGGMIMCSTDNLLTMFVGLELLSISLYVLAGMHKKSKASQEAALKYFLLGSFATGFFLYGIAFLYGAKGSLGLDSFKAFAIHGSVQEQPLYIFSFCLIMVGLCFKTGVVPFHQWVPDVYSGAPSNVVTFMATGAKIGPFVALYRLTTDSVMFNNFSYPICLALSVVSMVVGNILAFRQKDVKRILAYSSIVNAGYILIYLAGLVRQRGEGIWEFGFFLVAYVFATLGMFVLITALSKDDRQPFTFDSLRGLSRRNPGLAAALLIFVLSQIGIGPVAGFVGKALFVTHLVRLEEVWLAIVLLANSAFAAFYYLKIIKAAFSIHESEEEIRHEVCINTKFALAICLVGVVGTVLLYSPIYQFLVQQ